MFIGRAQEKTTVFRTEKRRDPDGVTYPWIVRTTGVINQFYFYCLDTDFGPFFLKFCSYFPYNAKLCINGHQWAQRQAGRAGIAFTAMDNAFADGDRPGRGAGHLRQARTGQDPRAVGQMAGDPAEPVHAGGPATPATGISSRSCRPSSP